MAVSDRGFASMDPSKQKRIAKKGGKTISADKEYMAKIGRKGGLASGKVRTTVKKAKKKKLEKVKKNIKN